MQNKAKGKQGEKIAEEYLKNKGWKILEKNFHYSKIAEIDLVAQIGENIVFVDIHSYMKEHNEKGEYLYFRTDHHWTGLGAYRAYTAFSSK